MRVYVAITGTGKVVRGAKGQSVFNSIETLRRSVGASRSMQHEADNMGCRVRDLYDVYEYSLALGKGEVVQ